MSDQEKTDDYLFKKEVAQNLLPAIARLLYEHFGVTEDIAEIGIGALTTASPRAANMPLYQLNIIPHGNADQSLREHVGRAAQGLVDLFKQAANAGEIVPDESRLADFGEMKVHFNPRAVIRALQGLMSGGGHIPEVSAYLCAAERALNSPRPASDPNTRPS